MSGDRNGICGDRDEMREWGLRSEETSVWGERICGEKGYGQIEGESEWVGRDSIRDEGKVMQHNRESDKNVS